ncbi:MAG: ATP-binding protein [Pseudomonadota bacterium]
MRQITLSIESRLENVILIRKCIQGLCRLAPFAESIVDDLQLCVSESINNVIEHSYQNQPGHQLSVKITLMQTQMEIEINDWGNAMPTGWLELVPDDPVDFDPDDIDSIPTGGWGLFIIKNKMDDVAYFSENKVNTLKLIKHFH